MEGYSVWLLEEIMVAQGFAQGGIPSRVWSVRGSTWGSGAGMEMFGLAR